MLYNKVAIVTGGASGIGRATADQMAREGAKVVIADIDTDKGRETAEEIGALYIHTDVSEPEQINAMVQQTVAEFGGVDILVNNAADLTLLADDDHLLNSTVETWQKTFRTDQLGAMVASAAVLPLMIERGGGSIINVTSVDGIKGDDTRFAYAMAKAALNMLTEMIATKYGKQGVRCNAVAPGLILTPPAKAGLPDPVRDAFQANALTPQYGGEPEDVAELICFLASDKAKFLTGEVIRLDGGLLAHMPHLSEMRNLSH